MSEASEISDVNEMCKIEDVQTRMIEEMYARARALRNRHTKEERGKRRKAKQKASDENDSDEEEECSDECEEDEKEKEVRKNREKEKMIRNETVDKIMNMFPDLKKHKKKVIKIIESEELKKTDVSITKKRKKKGKSRIPTTEPKNKWDEYDMFVVDLVEDEYIEKMKPKEKAKAAKLNLTPPYYYNRHGLLWTNKCIMIGVFRNNIVRLFSEKILASKL